MALLNQDVRRSLAPMLPKRGRQKCKERVPARASREPEQKGIRASGVNKTPKPALSRDEM
ncbi:predicted protein [Sclerotinia sclerotiorum 1980 UF-70]|uniref:Uncharacterized protein n=1 Tax=Sclerotinia sclerotiorum (strain ATCC 18683 / 1980 / Ss-1) TaxID=665079 RepID=A7E9T4_SCLS1|nr:predicted protein [Sclerotinia sclerotiorum 1980 UF-70]EDN97136.1 predicted protein [Sclerotinia sclerotiorum 1980 UF-70]